MKHALRKTATAGVEVARACFATSEMTLTGGAKSAAKGGALSADARSSPVHQPPDLSGVRSVDAAGDAHHLRSQVQVLVDTSGP